MTWNLFGQYLDIALTSILVVRVFNLGLQTKYLACLIFIVFDSFQSLIYIVDRLFYEHGINLVDYRILWASLEVASWITTIWMVYFLLIAILKQLPGILRFSLRFLNIVFAVSVVIALTTIRPEYAASGLTHASDWHEQVKVLISIMGRALSLAELLSILCVLTFVLRFPIRVPRNLAAFSAGLSVYLFLKIGVFLLRTYVPGLFFSHPAVFGIPGYYVAGCLIYWIVSINSTGEQVFAVLGRSWQAVPQERLVRQLEAMNAALLSSREHV